MNSTLVIPNFCGTQSIKVHLLPNCLISSTIQEGRIWEPHMQEIFDRYVSSESVVIEGGTHIGLHSLYLANRCKHLYSFEPMPSTNKIMCQNLVLNQVTNVTTSLCGLSDQVGSTTFAWVPPGNPGAAGLADNPLGIHPQFHTQTHTTRIPLTTVDALGLTKLDFIKLDVEGYESKVLAGAMATIRQCRPVITVEIWSDHVHGVNYEFAARMTEQILKCNYLLHHIEGPDFLLCPREKFKETHHQQSLRTKPQQPAPSKPAKLEKQKRKQKQKQKQKRKRKLKKKKKI